MPISAPFSEINSPSASPLPETAYHLLTHLHPLFHVPRLHQELGFEPTCICEQGLRWKMELISCYVSQHYRWEMMLDINAVKKQNTRYRGWRVIILANIHLHIKYKPPISPSLFCFNVFGIYIFLNTV